MTGRLTVEHRQLLAGSIKRVHGRQRTPLGDAWRRLRRNRAALTSLVVISGLALMALLADTALMALFTGRQPAPLLALHPYDAADFAHIYAPAFTLTTTGNHYLLGADYLGRDNLSRTLHGARVSLLIALSVTAMSLSIGMLYGLLAGYGSPARDNIMMRLVDFLYGFPVMISLILIQVYVKAVASAGATTIWHNWLLRLNQTAGGVFLIVIVLGLLNWLDIARLARGLTLTYKHQAFVESARTLGCRDWQILFHHLLPNVLGPCLVAQMLAVPGYIMTEALLSFIGLGVDPPLPSWGMMIAENYPALRTAPLALFVPSVTLTITALAFNFLGDGLRDAFDPKHDRTYVADRSKA